MGKNNHNNNNLLISSLISLQMVEVEAAKRAGACFAAVATRTNSATHQEMKVEKRKEIILQKKDERIEMNQRMTTTTTTTSATATTITGEMK